MLSSGIPRKNSVASRLRSAKDAATAISWLLLRAVLFAFNVMFAVIFLQASLFTVVVVIPHRITDAITDMRSTLWVIADNLAPGYHAWVWCLHALAFNALAVTVVYLFFNEVLGLKGLPVIWMCADGRSTGGLLNRELTLAPSRSYALGVWSAQTILWEIL